MVGKIKAKYMPKGRFYVVKSIIYKNFYVTNMYVTEIAPLKRYKKRNILKAIFSDKDQMSQCIRKQHYGIVSNIFMKS